MNATEQEVQRASVLVVDDNVENRALALAALEDDGYEVVLAESGRQALDAFARRPPDCVLLDIRMPEMDGFTTCAKIRALPGGSDVPIVFLTALRDVETFDQALRAGSDDFLTKPLRPAELAVRIGAILKLRRMGAELREYAAVVRRQRDDLMRVQLQNEQLTAFIVHDLKNPVHAIDLHAQLLLRKAGDSPVILRSGQLIRDEVRALSRLIFNLLDLHRSDSGKFALLRAHIALDSLVAQVLDCFQLRAKTDHIHLETELGVAELWADGDLLRRVLENLIDNALRHTPENGVVRLSARAVDGAVELRVSDSGPGIPPELRDRVFHRFVQLENIGAATSRGGRGLGLAFCKLAVEAHDGRLWIEDGAPGAVFCMRLPQEEP